MIGEHTIETVSGSLINVDNPDPKTIDINDAAWAISRISRFAGHTITEIPLNVAQHSIHVCDLILENEEFENPYVIALFGLLHDTGEYALGDIPSPVKHLPAIKDELDRIENRILWIIFDKYVGRQPTDDEWKIVKKYDWKACRLEAYHYMPSRGKLWVNAEKLDLIELQSYPRPMPAIEAYQKFLEKFSMLKSLIESTT